MADIESLELQITSDSKGAKDGLDALITTLDTLKLKTKGGCGLTTVANQVSKMAVAAGKLNGSEGAKLKSLADGLNALSGFGSLKLSSSIANQISAMGTAVGNLDGVNTSRLRDLATDIQPLTTLGKSNLGSVLNQLKKLPDVMAEISKVDMAAFKAKIDAVTASIKPLADEMQKVANGFAAFPAKIQKFINESNKVPSTNIRSGKSFANLMAKITALGYTLKRAAGLVASWINESNEYIEAMNLFTVSMGEYADAARDTAEDVSAVMGIDPAEWMKSQGVFMTLATGFGVAGDRASVMSEQLTQLGYDLSSFFNISVEEAMQKLKSGLSGELEPLRNLGFDLSKAALEAVALSKGIDKSYDSMTQAEKSQLRYYAIMTQVTAAHGDMARTLTDPANQIRVLKAQITQAARALGDLFLPILRTVLPWLIALAKMVRYLADSLAGLFGVKSESKDLGGLSNISSGASEISEEFDNATSSASKLKKTLLGIDELNVMSDSSSDGSGGDAGVSGGGFDFELPTYDFIGKATSEQIDKIVEKMKEWLGVTEDLDSWSDLFGTRLGNILTIVGIIGGSFLAWKISTSVVTGLEALKSFGSSGSKLGGVIGGLAGVGVAVTGIATIIKELSDNWEAIKNGDWSGVDKVTLAIGAIEAIGGIVTALAFFSRLKSSVDTAKATEQMTEVVTATDTISKSTSTLTSKLTTLVKDLALGIAIIAEVAVAAALIVGAIWLLGLELEQVGIAWEPVIANGNTVLIAMGIGTGILVAVGVATALLGTLGGAVCGQIGIGIAILAELGVAALLFIAEIWAIGKGLDEIGKAWDPVLDDGEDIATAIGLGTALLVGIGVVTAALGVATVASAGLLPLAIGLGTALLIELTAAFIVFTDSLIDVADQLKDDLHPALVDLNGKLPTLTTNMGNFTKFMTDFAGKVVDYTKANAIAGISATVDKIVGFFTTDPIERLSNEVEDQGDKMSKLVERLNEVNPIIKDADRLMNEFNGAMAGLKATTGISGNTPGTIGYTISIGIKLAKDGWTSVKDWLGKLNFKLEFTLPRIQVNWSTKTNDGFTIKYPSSFSTYAMGGFPDYRSGELFVAREAGPELVGSIGNRNAVVNNDQIVDSVSQGVARAVSQVMGSSRGDQVVEAKVNDKVLFEVLVSRARQETMRTGHNPLLGGV